ncbi:MAG: hypothetical protein AAGF12_36570 [Myxococcota bacterium]
MRLPPAVGQRDDTNLEIAALALTRGMVAEQSDYERLVADSAAISYGRERSDAWGLDGGGLPSFRSPTNHRGMLLEMDEESARAIQAGEYRDWSCLNEAYGITEIDTFFRRSGGGTVTLRLERVVATEVLARQYAGLPGVISVHTGSGYTDGSGFCVVRDGEVFHYVIVIGFGDCPPGCVGHDYHYIRTDGPGQISVRASYLDEDERDAPCWLDICDPFNPYAL